MNKSLKATTVTPLYSSPPEAAIVFTRSGYLVKTKLFFCKFIPVDTFQRSPMDASPVVGSLEKVRSVEKKAKKSKKHKKHKKSSKSDPEKSEKTKRSKSSKKKRRHSDETHSEAEEGHRSHKVKKTSESQSVKDAPESLKNVGQTTKAAAVVAPAAVVEVDVVVKRDRKSSGGGSSTAHIVTTKSNGQSKLLTNPKSSKLGGGIPTDPSKLVEILTKSLDTRAVPEPATEILSSDEEEANDR